MVTPSLLETPCPFLDGSQPVCCDDDSATIMGKFKNNNSRQPTALTPLTQFFGTLVLFAQSIWKSCGVNSRATLIKQTLVSLLSLWPVSLYHRLHLVVGTNLRTDYFQPESRLRLRDILVLSTRADCCRIRFNKCYCLHGLPGSEWNEPEHVNYHV